MVPRIRTTVRGSECIMIKVTGANDGGLTIIGVMHVHRRQACRIEASQR